MLTLRVETVSNRKLLEGPVEAKPNSEYYQPPKVGQAFWIDMPQPVQAVSSGDLHWVTLHEDGMLRSLCKLSDLHALGLQGATNITIGQTFQMRGMPVLREWIDICVGSAYQWLPKSLRLSQAEAVPPIRSAPKYRTPLAMRTPECPCGGGLHYRQCEWHQDWLSVE